MYLRRISSIRFYIVILLALFVFIPQISFADSPDMGIRSADIWFSESTLYVGDQIRIYAEISNKGDEDISAYAFFYKGDSAIGASQRVSIPQGGDKDAVWVDFTVPSGDFNIRAEIRGQDPGDINSSNDIAITTLFHPIFDEDRDSVEDEDDNCPQDSNSNQEDADSDGLGDVCDDDDDNDGITDDLEQELGTDDQSSDTDGDSVEDLQDAQPLEPQDVQDIEVVEGLEDVEDEEGIFDREAFGIVKTSTNADFSYQLITWKTYKFKSFFPLEDGRTLTWDFGDGVTSAQSEVEHTFRETGAYTVSLTVASDNGEEYKDTAEIDVTFFHMSNPLVRFLIGLLLLVFVGSLFAVLWRKGEDDKGHEESE